MTSGSYPAVRTFLRNADVLDFLADDRGIPSCPLLAQLDEFQNAHLPSGWDDMDERLKPRRDRREDPFGELRGAAAFVREQRHSFRRQDIEEAVRAFLQTVYGSRSLGDSRPDDVEFQRAAEQVGEALRELTGVKAVTGGKAESAELLHRRLAEQVYRREPPDALVDLEGWLELPWNDAPLLVVTGMNEGKVPDSRPADAFLPDSLRRRLGLRDDAGRFARDSFLMRGFMESRRRGGRVCFVAGKTSADGDPLKPSRLLFRCADGELPARAERLFGAADDHRENYPSTFSFTLDARPPDDVDPDALRIERLSVTSFRDYLACPFRYYLRHVLRMEELHDAKPGPDALDFGTMLHAALQRMAEDPRMRDCDDERELAAFLANGARDWSRQRFGDSPGLPVTAALAAAVERLAAAARVQAGLVREGWETIASERKLDVEWHGVRVRGKIDRVDRHRETGQLRILDYKTSDSDTPPASSHLGTVADATPDYARVIDGKRERRWTDLQLPLYRILLAEETGRDDPADIGYFNLPKAVTHTGVSLWDGFGQHLLDSARACALEVVGRIRRFEFWPPADRVLYDDFEDLLPDTAAVDEDTFTRFLEGLPT
jgi:ATP-dependent helicase/nuclease subunit B